MPRNTFAPPRIRRNLSTGLGLGVFAATALTLWVSWLRLSIGTAPFDRLHVTYLQVVIGYYLAGLVGGLLMGLAWPIRRWLLGYVTLGILGVFPMYLFAPTNWTRAPLLSSESIASSLVFALFVGGGVGVWAWSDDHPHSPHWFDLLRYPSPATVGYVWAVALLLAALWWYLIPKWTVRWPDLFVLVTAGLMFVLPLVTAILVSVRLRDQRRGGRRAA